MTAEIKLVKTKTNKQTNKTLRMFIHATLLATIW